MNRLVHDASTHREPICLAAKGIDVVGVDHVSDFHVTRYATVKVRGAFGALAAGC